VHQTFAICMSMCVTVTCVCVCITGLIIIFIMHRTVQIIIIKKHSRKIRQAETRENTVTSGSGREME